MIYGECLIGTEGVQVPAIFLFDQQDNRFAGWIFRRINQVITIHSSRLQLFHQRLTGSVAPNASDETDGQVLLQQIDRNVGSASSGFRSDRVNHH
jgi:hypothetical protein